MRRPRLVTLSTAIATLAVSTTLSAETRITRDEDGGLSVTQTSPAGSVHNEQVLIIEGDRYGNQRVLDIGSTGGKSTATTVRMRPCRRGDPTERMDCRGRDLRDVRWDGAVLTAGMFDNADLRGASLRGAHLNNSTFSETNLEGADLRDARLMNTDFDDARLRGASFKGANLTNCDFSDAQLVRASLADAVLVNCDFDDADLRGADLTGAQLINTGFDDAELSAAVWADRRTCGEGSVGRCR